MVEAVIHLVNRDFVSLSKLYVNLGFIPPDTGSFFFFFITVKPRVEWYTTSVSLKYEAVSEPLHIFVKLLFSN